MALSNQSNFRSFSVPRTQRDHCKRAILFLSSSKILTPHPPLRPASVYPSPMLRGEDRLAERRGGWGSIFWKTREIGLPSYNDLSTPQKVNLKIGIIPEDDLLRMAKSRKMTFQDQPNLGLGQAGISKGGSDETSSLIYIFQGPAIPACHKPRYVRNF